MDKKSFILYNSYKESFDALSDEQLGKLIKAIFNYTEHGEIPELDIGLNFAFLIIKSQIDRDCTKWEMIKEKRIQSGKLGGKAKASKSRQVLASASKSKQNVANLAVDVNVNGNVNVDNISKDIGTDVPATYGNEDINRLIKGINLNLGYSLPNDTRARRTASNILQVMDKNGVNGVKDGRAWLTDDKWANIKKFLKDYIEFRVADGYGAESWFSFYDNVKLWIANEGKFPKSK